MDMRNGNFKKIDNQEDLQKAMEKLAKVEQKSMQELVKRLFQVGEEVKIKDSTFRIKKITKKGLNLKLLPHEKT